MQRHPGWRQPARRHAAFGPSNPFYAPSTLPFQAPPFDRIKDEDYQPAVEAGMARQAKEIRAIADASSKPTFDNTMVPLERSGLLLARAHAAFSAVAQANTNPVLQAAKAALAPQLAAHHDAIYLNRKLFARVAALHEQRDSVHLDPESRRLIDVTYDEFVHSGAGLSDADKAALQKLNEEASTLSDSFTTKLLAATTDAALHTASAAALAGLSDSEMAAAAQAARSRNLDGYVLPLQNTTQQPALVSLRDRPTRQALFDNSWTRAQRGDANDTRAGIARLAQLRAQRARLLGFPNHAAWKLQDQMAKSPDAVLEFLDALVPVATAKAAREGADIQALIDEQHLGFTLEAWDWNFYADQVRKAKYSLDEAQLKPYFELGSTLENGVFYAANRLYGVTFRRTQGYPGIPIRRARLRGHRRRRQTPGAVLLRLFQA